MSTAASAPHEHSIKETIISLLISFVMALVFRSYVVEAFVIPTGSMAPTLLGKHVDYRSDATGYAWAQNPTYYHNREVPYPVQGGAFGQDPISATDPMTTSRFNEPSNLDARRYGISTARASKPLLAGDRILVQKYLYEVFPPTRYDVVVFKNPNQPMENYIKRLIGLPNEQVLLVEGDVFSRPLDGEGDPTGDGEYEIRRKPRRVMADLWRPIFSSEYEPRVPSPGFTYPWTGEGWDARERTLVNERGPSTLVWDSVNWPVWDWEPYNEPVAGGQRQPLFPVGDVRMRAGIEPSGEGTDVTMSVRVREHEFQAQLVGTGATIRMRRAVLGAAPGEWTTLATGEIGALPGGEITNVELWHFDQSLELHVGDEVVATARYDWSASDRYLHTVGATREAFELDEGDVPLLSDDSSYRRAAPSITWSFSGPVTLHRVGLDRDIYYRPWGQGYRYGHGSHPRTAIKLGPDHFFCCGDNSPQSSDGRAWDSVDPLVAATVDDTAGVVHRDLMLGKAFFVYFPSIYKFLDRVPIPNAGDMRLIR